MITKYVKLSGGDFTSFDESAEWVGTQCPLSDDVEILFDADVPAETNLIPQMPSLKIILPTVRDNNGHSITFKLNDE